MAFNTKGQGALEYLLLIGGAVLIAVIVISIASGLINTQSKPNPNDPLCAALSQSRCGDEVVGNVDGSLTTGVSNETPAGRDCGWRGGTLNSCVACKIPAGSTTILATACPKTTP